jgi:hypothetical protein
MTATAQGLTDTQQRLANAETQRLYAVGEAQRLNTAEAQNLEAAIARNVVEAAIAFAEQAQMFAGEMREFAEQVQVFAAEGQLFRDAAKDFVAQAQVFATTARRLEVDGVQNLNAVDMQDVVTAAAGLGVDARRFAEDANRLAAVAQ